MIRFREFVTLLLFLGVTACAESGEVPLTIPEDQMVTLLIDLHVLESALQDVTHSKRDSVKTAFYNQFYEIHNIKEETLVENIEIMDHQPKVMSRIYSKVMEEVSKLEVED